VKRLREEDLRKLLEESSKLLEVKTEVLAIDSTGLREDNANFYYAKRSGKKRKNWRKLTIVVDTDSQAIISANIGVGPSNDGVILREMFEKGLIPSCQVLLADCRVTKNLLFSDRLEEGVVTNLLIESISSPDDYSAALLAYTVKDGKSKQSFPL